jgi:hypothetical protein
MGPSRLLVLAGLLATFRRGRPSDRDFGRLIQRGKASVRKLANRLASGALTAEGFVDELAALLDDAHAHAALLGRQLGGDFAPFEDDDREFGARVVDEEAEYLFGFQEALQARDPRYFDGDSLRVEAVIRRANMYLGRLRSTANESFILTDLEADYAWEMLATEHCVECPVLASDGPYSGEELLALGKWPGHPSLPCKFNCGCVIVRLTDGQFGFSRLYDLSP